ncbi:MAG: hypothetical protein J5849_04875 [Clostridia bacterium]|nr:hypothetical protein [Clostridia bacterium]
MRILLASPDRDLLWCYMTLFREKGIETAEAFDGAQTLAGIGEGGVDLLILAEDVPRVEEKRITSYANETGLPLIVLCTKEPGVRELSSGVLANAYLAHPFTPEDLEKTLAEVNEKRNSEELIPWGREGETVSRFTLRGERVTAREIGFLEAFREGKSVKAEDGGAYLAALTGKMKKTGIPGKVRYRPNEGFRWVDDHEES